MHDVPGMEYSPEATLDDLPSMESSIEYTTPGEEVLFLFERNPNCPGVIVIKENKVQGLISRDAFFEKTGKKFGVEIFLNRPIHLMLEDQRQPPLILPAREQISQAIFKALKRNMENVYDPIIIEKSRTYRIIDILSIFMAENNILLNLHKQHLFTVSSGMAISDSEAARDFSKFTGILEETSENILSRRYTVACEICHSSISFSIADVIRSYPQITQGIEIHSRMGNQSYIVYIRHSCGGTIREIPVQFDDDFNIRALRPSRLVETYVQSTV